MHGDWQIETRKGWIKRGWWYEDTEKIRVLSKENGRRIIEAVVLSNVHVDSGGNESIDTHKGYHDVALLEGKAQLSFAFKIKNGWRVLSDDCLTFVKDVKTKREAIELLPTAAKGVSN